MIINKKYWEEKDWDIEGYNKDNYKKKNVEFCSFKRPHMRAFHFSWFTFMCCFMMWFSIPSLMGTIKKPKCLDLNSSICINCLNNSFTNNNLTYDVLCRKCYPNDINIDAGCGGIDLNKNNIIISNIVSVIGTIFIRILIGPFIDIYGPKIIYSGLLLLLSIPGFFVALIYNFETLIIIRILISLIGGSFVITSIWTMNMFDSNCIGFASATTAGLGNTGAGIILQIMPLIFIGLHNLGYNNNDAWRISVSLPPILLLILSFLILFNTDDCPLGDINRLNTNKINNNILNKSFKIAIKNWKTWLCASIYALSFGTEITVNNNMSLYLQEEFKFSQHNSGLIAGIFGLVNIFARSLGGYMSDKFYFKNKILGRYWCLFIQTFIMGILLCSFTTLNIHSGMFSSILLLSLWAIFTAMTEGGVFSIVPSIEPYAVGGVSGIVGAGGNIGALFGMSIMFLGYRTGFLILGIIPIFLALILLYILIIKKNYLLVTDNIHMCDRKLTAMSIAYMPQSLNNLENNIILSNNGTDIHGNDNDIRDKGINDINEISEEAYEQFNLNKTYNI